MKLLRAERPGERMLKATASELRTACIVIRTVDVQSASDLDTYLDGQRWVTPDETFVWPVCDEAARRLEIFLPHEFGSQVAIERNRS